VLSHALVVGLCGLLVAHALVMITFVILRFVERDMDDAVDSTWRGPFPDQSVLERIGRLLSVDPWYFPYQLPQPNATLSTMPGCLVLGFLLLIPVGFLSLTFTLRKMKVRPRHVFRLACYSLWLIPLVCFLAPSASLITRLSWSLLWVNGSRRNLPGWNARAGIWPDALLLHIHHVVLALVLLFAMGWWARSIAVYLRVPRPWFVALVLTVMASLGILAIAYVAPPFSQEVPHLLYQLFT